MNTRPRLTRRQVLGATALSTLSGAAFAAEDNYSKRRTFVLVHGAWHGGWCWKKVSPLLREAGHDVFTPTLTGLGERSHLLNPQIDLTTHIQDIVAVLEYEDSQDVILVGHSYSGMVIAGVAGKASERLAHLIHLDAFLPESGKAMSANSPRSPAAAANWRTPPKSMTFSVTDTKDIAWMKTRLGDHPTKTLTQPVQFDAASYAKIAKTYIQCTTASFFVEAVERAKRQGFRYRQLLAAGHDAMITQPKELVSLFLEVV
jgi:pimeloyl-ACP methyl ester carboxylesterase